MDNLTKELKKRHSYEGESVWNQRINEHTYVLNALRKSIITNETFSLFYFRSLEPRYTFVYKPTQHLHPDKIRHGRVSRQRDGRRILYQPSHEIKRGASGRQARKRVNVWIQEFNVDSFGCIIENGHDKEMRYLRVESGQGSQIQRCDHLGSSEVRNDRD